MKITRAVQQRQFDTCDLGETSIALYWIEEIGLIHLSKSGRRLVKKLKAVEADLDIPQLLWRNHLKNHGRLVG